MLFSVINTNYILQHVDCESCSWSKKQAQEEVKRFALGHGVSAAKQKNFRHQISHHCVCFSLFWLLAYLGIRSEFLPS